MEVAEAAIVAAPAEKAVVAEAATDPLFIVFRFPFSPFRFYK